MNAEIRPVLNNSKADSTMASCEGPQCGLQVRIDYRLVTMRF